LSGNLFEEFADFRVKVPGRLCHFFAVVLPVSAVSPTMVRTDVMRPETAG